MLTKKNNNFNLYKKLKEAANIYKQFPITTMVGTDNKILLTKNGKLQTWLNYVANAFNDARQEPGINYELTGPPILESEVAYTITQAKTGKASGPGKVCTELLKQLNEENIPIITQLFNKIYDTSIIPLGWLKSIFITLPKKTSGRRCEDYRPISLMSHTLKVFLKPLETGSFSGRKMIVVIGLSILNQNVPTKP